MPKVPRDEFGHIHTPIRPKGYRVTRLKLLHAVKPYKGKPRYVVEGFVNLEKPLIDEVKLDINYKESWLAIVRFVLHGVVLFSLPIAFCQVCGKKLGFDTFFGLCQSCNEGLDKIEAEFEDEENWEAEFA